MNFVLGIVLATVCVLVCVLFHYDLSPKVFLYKIANRFFGVPERFRPTVRDAPYRRVRHASNGLHRPVLLNLETSDGSGQTCHPDVAYIPDGFGAKKWPYWMVCTPYPYQDARFENPEIFVSYDGLTWSVPDGVRNPPVPSLPIPGDHNSDPDIVFHDGELWLFFRETIRSKSPNENSIFLMKSADGARWTAPTKILSDKGGTELLSPAVIHDGNEFVMWTVEMHGGELKLMRRSGPDALSWSNPSSCSIIGLDEGRFPWHVDVIQEEDRLSALLVSCEQLGGGKSRIHYSYSEDQGLTWFAGGFLFDQVYEFEANAQYRGSLHKISDELEEYELWYSAASFTNMFSIAYLRLVRTEGNTLVPREMCPDHVEASPIQK